ncbi:radical SAM family heme chaperone HemW [bacterium]|nr:radical SAM family heme chaperone HemW [bacterium]
MREQAHAGLYIHIPWCVAKCPYCDFNSHGLNGREPAQDRYVEALVADLAWEAEQLGPHHIDSIFFGGGTPSLFAPDSIALILEAVDGQFDLDEQAEITLEANPGASEAAHFAGYRGAGVNRLSIGVQSLDDAHLKRLGRIHNAAEAQTAYLAAREAGFDNINLDLMFALPEQSVAGAAAELAELIAWSPEHISYYQLTLEPGTAFGRRPPPLPAEDDSVAMWEAGMARLAAAGYAQYEVSAYARDGKQCRHNLTYWTFGDYIGVGAGAHGKSAGSRRERIKTPAQYMQAAGSPTVLAGAAPIADEAVLFEYMMNRLRLNAPIARREFERATGLRWAGLASAMSNMRDRDLVTSDDKQLSLTPLGRHHLDDVISGFLP